MRSLRCKKKKLKKKFLHRKKDRETVIGYTFRVGYIYRADCNCSHSLDSVSLRVLKAFKITNKFRSFVVFSVHGPAILVVRFLRRPSFADAFVFAVHSLHVIFCFILIFEVSLLKFSAFFGGMGR